MRCPRRLPIASALLLLVVPASCGSSQKAETVGPAAPAAEAGGEPEAPAPDKPAEQEAALLAAEMQAYEKARPVFEAHCVRCHTSGGDAEEELKGEAREHVSMDEYPFGGHHVGELGDVVREVLGGAGKDAIMPLDDPGSVQGEELQSIFAWADAYEKAQAAGAGYHGRTRGTVHEHEHEHGD